MKAFVINKVCDLQANPEPLELVELPVPVPGVNDILIRISCCGVCHTELDEIEGRTPPSSYPMIPGHQVIGIVELTGANVKRLKKGDRVGVAWIFSACGECEYCRKGLENLCEKFMATGRDAPGGYAEFMTAPEESSYLVPPDFADEEAAPLLCAGAIGYRSLRLAGLSNGQTLGLTGFGASGHLVLKMAKHLYPDSRILVFARSKEEQAFARKLGANWAGDFSSVLPPPSKANAIIDTTPVWNTVIESLLHLKQGGRLVINAIRKESRDLNSLLGLRYEDHLWMEKEIKSVANITRRDVTEFLSLAATIPIKPEVECNPFAQANQALLDLKHRPIRGAKVLKMVDR